MYHTGLVVGVSNNRVYTIEGNTSSAAGVVPNGGCVRDKSYPLGASYIGGYGRPDYSLVQDTRGGCTGRRIDRRHLHRGVRGLPLRNRESLGVAWQSIAHLVGR